MAWWLGLLAGVPGLFLREPILVSLAGVFLPLGFFIDDVSRARRGGITAMTAYSAAAAATSMANTVALLSANGPRRWEYYLYVSEPHVFFAICLALAAAVIPPLTFRILASSRTAGLLEDLLPRVRGEIGDRQLVRFGLVLGLVGVLVHWRYPSGSLGSLSSIIWLAPLFMSFVLARAGAERHVRGALVGAIIVASAEAMRALFTGYLRGDVAAPFIALVLGALTGARSLRPLRSRVFIPVYGFLALFVIYFGAFGAVRGSSRAGLSRLAAVLEFREQQSEAPEAASQTVLSRLTTINQLSQVGRLASEDGLLHGQTLDYLAYAFIPRFLWPAKPDIAKGAWFALKIGQANIRPDGSIANSVNMTIPGELYLNYGWPGVFAGLAFLGAFISAFWRSTGFWSGSANVLGTAFAFYLMWPWVGFSLGADLQILVTIIAVYMLLVAAGWLLPSLRRVSRALSPRRPATARV